MITAIIHQHQHQHHLVAKYRKAGSSHLILLSDYFCFPQVLYLINFMYISEISPRVQAQAARLPMESRKPKKRVHSKFTLNTSKDITLVCSS